MVATRSLAFLNCWTTQGWSHDCSFSTACWKNPHKTTCFLMFFVEWIPPRVFDIFFYFLVNSAYVYTVSILMSFIPECRTAYIHTVLLLHIWCRRFLMTLYTWKLTDAFASAAVHLSAMESRNHGIYQCWTSFALWNLPTTNHVNKNWCDPSTLTSWSSWPSCRLWSREYAKARETCWIALG